MQTLFENLPITITNTEYRDGWSRDVAKEGRVADLLEIWDIDDPNESGEMEQVLRLLRDVFADRERLLFLATRHCSHNHSDWTEILELTEKFQ